MLEHEGGYAVIPPTPVGQPIWGSPIRRWPAGARFRPDGPPKAEVKALNLASVTPIYRKNYWDAVRGDDLPAGLDLALFDFAVNSGPGRAAITLQTKRP
ncbi:glycosyl hydrolase 108 family protein [Devosia sp. A449]